MGGGDPREPYDQAEDTDVSWQQPDDEELAFADDDERLPWLESGEDDEAARGFDSGRLIGFGLLALVVLALIGGAIWWFMNSGERAGPTPDGSVIAAPEDPYKTKPENPGGKIHEGTGDTSFAVGEGETREGRLREDPAPAPSPTAAPSPSVATVAPQPTADEPPRGTLVQVGAYSRRAQAQDGWRTLMGQTTLLNGVKYRIVRGQADIGIVYRLQATMGSRAEAQQLCSALKGDGLACQVK